MLVDSDFRAEPGGGLSDRRRTGAGSGSPAKAPEDWRSPRRFATSWPVRAGASFLDCASPLALFPTCPNRALIASGPVGTSLTRF